MGFYSTVSISSRNFLPRTCSVVTGQRCHQTDLARHGWKLAGEDCSSLRMSLFWAAQMLRAIVRADGASTNDSAYGEGKKKAGEFARTLFLAVGK